MNIARARGLAEALRDDRASSIGTKTVAGQILDALDGPLGDEHPLAPMYPSGFNPSLVRRALDYLLDAYPMFDLVSLDWQIGDTVQFMPGDVGPWVLVEMGQPSGDFERMPAWALWRFAIWKTTGALHSMDGGAVSDDPIWTP